MIPSRRGRHRRSLRPLMLLGAVAVLLGGLAAGAHAAVPHGDHEGHGACSVCSHLDRNPAEPAAGPAPPRAAGPAFLAPVAATDSDGTTPVVTRSRAPPLPIQVPSQGL